MKAIQYSQFGGPEVLKVVNVPIPEPLDSEVLIKIHYAGLNPVDWKVREGLLQKAIPFQFPITPGWDASGVVEKIGKGVKHFKVGDEVFTYCRKELLQGGTYAEYIAIDENAVAKKPSNISFSVAASIPLVALTAWQALYDILQLKKGDVILIQAGAGGVGSLALQIAKRIGAFVITTTSSKNSDYVRSLGADLIVNYDKENMTDVIRKAYPNGIDSVFEMIGGKSMDEAAQLIKKGGSMVSIVLPLSQERAKELGITSLYCFVRPNGEELSKIAELIQQKKLKVPPIEEWPLDQAAQAQEKNKEGHTRGKIVLKVR